MSNPKLFISYSWSSPDHEKWVLTFAEELISQGINVVLDKWDLKPGHDANAFMEAMVTDPDVTKVILICDKQYVEKSNKRSGGAGTEAQIITPELYAKREQDKFVAVIRERDDDGKAFVPAYYGSRIYFDLSNPSTYATEFENLVRWAWGRPVYVKPEVGKKPAYLFEEVGHIKIATSAPFRKAIEAIKNSRDNAVPATLEYFDTLASELERFRICYNGPEFDELVMNSITDFRPFRNELIEMFETIAIYHCTSEMVEALHCLFEKLMTYFIPPQHITQWTDTNFDNFYFIVHELFLYCHAVLLKRQRFDVAAFLIDNEYFYNNRITSIAMHSFVDFMQHVRSLDARNQRLNLRRLSLRAHLLKERNQATGVDFTYLMEADLVLYLRSWGQNASPKWWPETLIWTTHRGAMFEMFARSKSERYFDRIKGLLSVKDKAELGKLLEKIEAAPDHIPCWQFDSINPRALVQFESLSSTP
jgi:hypothetical protein